MNLEKLGDDELLLLKKNTETEVAKLNTRQLTVKIL